MSNHNFKKYLVRQMTDKGAVLVSEIEIAEGSLSELLEENRIVKPDEISVVQPEPLDPKIIEQCPPFHRELTMIAAKNGGIFPATNKVVLPGEFTQQELSFVRRNFNKLKGFFNEF